MAHKTVQCACFSSVVLAVVGAAHHPHVPVYDMLSPHGDLMLTVEVADAGRVFGGGKPREEAAALIPDWQDGWSDEQERFFAWYKRVCYAFPLRSLIQCLFVGIVAARRANHSLCKGLVLGLGATTILDRIVATIMEIALRWMMSDTNFRFTPLWLQLLLWLPYFVKDGLITYAAYKSYRKDSADAAMLTMILVMCRIPMDIATRFLFALWFEFWIVVTTPALWGSLCLSWCCTVLPGVVVAFRFYQECRRDQAAPDQMDGAPGRGPLLKAPGGVPMPTPGGVPMPTPNYVNVAPGGAGSAFHPQDPNTRMQSQSPQQPQQPQSQAPGGVPRPTPNYLNVAPPAQLPGGGAGYAFHPQDPNTHTQIQSPQQPQQPQFEAPGGSDADPQYLNVGSQPQQPQFQGVSEIKSEIK